MLIRNYQRKSEVPLDQLVLWEELLSLSRTRVSAGVREDSSYWSRVAVLIS